jgi:hypothetical protein
MFPLLLFLIFPMAVSFHKVMAVDEFFIFDRFRLAAATRLFSRMLPEILAALGTGTIGERKRDLWSWSWRRWSK